MHVVIHLSVCVQIYRHFVYHKVEERLNALPDVWLEVSLGKTESPLWYDSIFRHWFLKKNLNLDFSLASVEETIN